MDRYCNTIPGSRTKQTKLFADAGSRTQPQNLEGSDTSRYTTSAEPLRRVHPRKSGASVAPVHGLPGRTGRQNPLQGARMILIRLGMVFKQRLGWLAQQLATYAMAV